MANWKEVTERWLPIVEKMEEHSMDDYAIPEIYRAAEKRIEKLEREVRMYAGSRRSIYVKHLTERVASLKREKEFGKWIPEDRTIEDVLKMLIEEADAEEVKYVLDALLIAKETNDED